MKLCGLLLVFAAGRPSSAQRRSTLDVGLSLVRFPEDSTTAFGPSASWMLAAERRHYFGSATVGGVVTRPGSSGSAELVGGGRAAFAPHLLGQASSELGGILGANGRTASSGLLTGELLRPIGGGGGWLRASGSVASRESGAMWGRGVGAGAWWRWWRAEFTTSLSREWSAGQLFIASLGDHPVGVVPVRYTEAAMTMRVAGDAASIVLGAGVRRDADAAHLYEPSLSATASFWQTANRALVISVARQLPDFIRGGDAVQYVTVGMRFNEPGSRATRAERMRPTLQITGGADSARVLRVYAPRARRVEIMADFTGWEPVSLVPGDGAFTFGTPLAPGTHRVVVRVDGGAWAPAANTPAVDDDFGGRVGLLLVP